MEKTVKWAVALLAIVLAVAASRVYWQAKCAAETAAPMPQLHAYAADGDGYTVDLNTADEELLAYLPHVGQTLAKRIVEYRQTHGAFTQVDELTNVEGIGEETLKRIAPFLHITRSSP